MSTCSYANMDAGMGRHAGNDKAKAFGALAVMSGISLACIAATALSAIPDSPTMIRSMSWTAADYGDSRRVHAGLMGMAIEEPSKTTAFGWTADSCKDSPFCKACSAAAPGTIVALVAAFISTAVSIASHRARSCPMFAGSEFDRRMGVASSLTAAASALYAISHFTEGCQAEGLHAEHGNAWTVVAFVCIANTFGAVLHAVTAAAAPGLPFTRKFQSSGMAVRPQNATTRMAAGDSGFDIEGLPGILQPTGFWDPVGISDGKSEARLRWFREAEIKHGRVCMLAATGFLLAENYHPLFGGEVDIPAIDVFSDKRIPANFWWPVVTTISGLEMASVIASFKNPNDALWELKDDHVLGGLGFDPLGLKPDDPETLLEKQNKELQNGRLAMLGTAGMISQELVDHQQILKSPAFQTNLIGKASADDLAVLDHVTNVAKEMAEMLNVTFHQ